jgi:hypothetical protein
MRKIRTEMYAVTYKGKLCKTPSGLYMLYPFKRDAMAYSPTHGVVKVTVTIQPKE